MDLKLRTVCVLSFCLSSTCGVDIRVAPVFNLQRNTAERRLAEGESDSGADSAVPNSSAKPQAHDVNGTEHTVTESDAQAVSEAEAFSVYGGHQCTTNLQRFTPDDGEALFRTVYTCRLAVDCNGTEESSWDVAEELDSVCVPGECISRDGSSNLTAALGCPDFISSSSGVECTLDTKWGDANHTAIVQKESVVTCTAEWVVIPADEHTAPENGSASAVPNLPTGHRDLRCFDDAAWVDSDGDGCVEYLASRTWCRLYGVSMSAVRNCPATCGSPICLQHESDIRHYNSATGSACKTQPCRHGGSCAPTTAAHAGYRCLCSPGWIGPKCEAINVCGPNATKQHEDGKVCVPPIQRVQYGPDRDTRTTIVCFLTSATLAGVFLILGGHVRPLRQCVACGVPYSLADGARLVAYFAVPMNLMTVIYTLALGYVEYAPLFLALLLLANKASNGAARVTPDAVIWLRLYLIKEVIATVMWSFIYTWAVYQDDVGGRAFQDAIFYFIAYLIFEAYSIYIIWSFLKRFSAGELEPDPTNAEVRMRRRREARERARANLLEAWARAGRIRFNDANFWDEVEAAAVAAEGRQSDAGGISQTAIAELPVGTFSQEDADRAEAAGAEADFSEDATCVICMEDYEIGDELITLPACSHRYHATCIAAWLDKNNSCPNCRVTAVEVEETPPPPRHANGLPQLTDDVDARDFFRLLNQMTMTAGRQAVGTPQAANIMLGRSGPLDRGERLPPSPPPPPPPPRDGDDPDEAFDDLPSAGARAAAAAEAEIAEQLSRGGGYGWQADDAPADDDARQGQPRTGLVANPLAVGAFSDEVEDFEDVEDIEAPAEGAGRWPQTLEAVEDDVV